MQRSTQGVFRRLNHAPQYFRNWVLDRTGPHGTFTLVLTNDPDHGRTEDYARVFRELSRLGLKITTSVFCTMEDDGGDLGRHCYRGETHTLADPRYRELMLELQEQGHEIAFHGYSQVSNTRDKFMEGLEIFKETFGHYPFTYIEHGGNPNKHRLEMCKQETLAMEGFKRDSPYYVLDIIQKKISCVWAWHDLIDNDYQVKQMEDLFYRRNGVIFFRRARLHYLDTMVRDVAHQGGVFMGYTHFGYDGYPNEPRYRYENWTGEQLRLAVKGFERLLAHHEVTNLTVKELILTNSELSGGEA